MTIKQDTPANVDGDEQFQLALLKVMEEFNVLTAGKPQMSIRETIDMREYVKKKTDLEKPDEQLTHTQKAWKLLYGGLSTELAKSMGKDELEKLDKLRCQLEQRDAIQQNVEQLFQLGRQIEEYLLIQYTYLNVHFESDNKYIMNEKILSEIMLAESTTNQRRVETAKSILDMIDKYKVLMLKRLFDGQEKLYGLLTEFSSIYKQTPFAVADNDEGISKIKTLYGEWLSLTEELHKERLKGITGVRNLVELDALIPEHIIKNNGDKTVNLPSEEFAQKCAAATILLQEGSSKEKEIAKKRTPISIEVFGEPDSYIKVQQGNTQQGSEESGSRKGKSFFSRFFKGR